MTYIYVEYPKWIKTLDNRDIIVQNKEEEELHTKPVKKEKENEPITDNSKGLDKKVAHTNPSTGSGRKSK